MNLKNFKEELLTYCKNGGLDVGFGCVGVNLNFYYCIFRFDEYDLEYRTCCAAPCRRIRYDEINENFLQTCKYIANVWIIKQKKQKTREKLFEMRFDFETNEKINQLKSDFDNFKK